MENTHIPTPSLAPTFVAWVKMIARSKDGVDLMYDRPRYSDPRLH
jgi:hypothetical protein